MGYKRVKELLNGLDTLSYDYEMSGSLEYAIFNISDAIEAEIDSKFMELPLDAEQVPVRPGEKMRLFGSERGSTVIGVSDGHFIVSGGIKHEASRFKHAEPPRTVDDILAELESVPKGKRYADELRSIIERDGA